MVLGEPQILGQMKQAVRAAEAAGTLGMVLHKLFQRTFSVAKEVRTQTEIGASSVSMAAAAVQLAERIFPGIAEQSVLFIGAGEMIELCATHFARSSPRNVTFANRTIERAADLADAFSARSVALNDLAAAVRSTTSSSPVRPARCRSSARVIERASSRAGTVRCSWSTWPCRATSKPKSPSWTTCSCTPWTISARWCRRAWRRARMR